MSASLVGSEMCIRDRFERRASVAHQSMRQPVPHSARKGPAIGRREGASVRASCTVQRHAAAERL
eukprot:2000848-Alexandrium_andersonii.AAC.1